MSGAFEQSVRVGDGKFVHVSADLKTTRCGLRNDGVFTRFQATPEETTCFVCLKPPIRVTTRDGYVRVRKPGHPRASIHGHVFEHLLVAERALGRPVPVKHPVHHINERKDDNRPSNLVICESPAYHSLIHQRMEALRASGHAGWLLCEICKQYDDPAQMWVSPTKASRAMHRGCHAANQLARNRAGGYARRRTEEGRAKARARAASKTPGQRERRRLWQRAHRAKKLALGAVAA